MPWPPAYDRLVLPRIDSTSAEAARQAGTDRGAVWRLALEQTAARGRRGRPWAQPPGNFSATLSFEPPGGPALAAQRSFTAALALHEAIDALAGCGGGLALKWPNDLLLNGGKLAGILLETVGPRGGRLAVGIGVNLIAAPPPDAVEPGAIRPVALLPETGCRLAPEDLLDTLAERFDAWERRLVQQGFAPVRAAWLARAARLGEPITARLPRERLTGIFETVDDTGALVLKTAGGRVTLSAADVFF